MMELFLVAHKVRGEPAFDVASQVVCAVCGGKTSEPANADWEHQYECAECDSTGYWWIVPTSGHRAYPWWHKALNDMWECGPATGTAMFPCIEDVPPMPPTLPDHYTSRAATVVPSGLAALLAKRKPLNVERRGR